MDILFAVIALAFMACFLTSIENIVRKEKASGWIASTSILFGILFWISIMIFYK